MGWVEERELGIDIENQREINILVISEGQVLTSCCLLNIMARKDHSCKGFQTKG